MISRRTLVCAFVAALVLAPVQVLAHTSLVSSTPADRAVLVGPPTSVRLVFANAVEPKLVTLYILGSDGKRKGEGTRTTADAPATDVVEFSVPSLPLGVYGIEWQSLGVDGHRVAGEIVVSIGRTTPAAQATSDIAGRPIQASGDPWSTVPAGAGRFAWYLGLSLAVGALFALWVTRDLASGAAVGPAEVIGRSAARAMGAGLWLALAGVALRWAFAMIDFVRFAGGSSLSTRVMNALTSPGGTAGALGVLVLAWTIRAAAPLRRQSTSARASVSVGGGLALTALLLATTGHGATDSTLGVLLAAGHVMAAAAWLGPLAVAGLAVASDGWRTQDPGARGAVMRGYFARFAGVAFWAFAVLVLSGVRAAWVNLGPRLRWNQYGLALTVKLVLLLAVIAPLGLYHDRLVRGRRAASRLLGAGFGKTIRAEAAALLAVLVVASALTGLNPKSGPASATVGVPGASGSTLAAAPVSNVSECAKAAVGGPRCYREYFAKLMRDKGAEVALKKIEGLQASDAWIRTRCHQVVHDLGNDAAVYYKNLAKALSVDGSACASGYYHGVVAKTLAETPDERLKEKVPTVCSEVAAHRYSSTHFSCLHGLGHGLMLRSKSDLWKSIPLCEAFTEPWERTSCVGGVFMENIVSAQQGAAGGVLKDDDPLYPCDAVATEHKGQCYRLQTSFILWKNGRNYAQAFAACDKAEKDFVADCYKSMGRDISGDALLDARFVVEKCNLGAEAMRVNCISAASENAVNTDHDTKKATELCKAADEAYKPACIEARDRIMDSFRRT